MDKSARTHRLIKIPFHLIGVILFMVGLLDWLAKTNIVPMSLQFDNYPIIFIIAGILIVFPHKQPFESLDQSK